MPLKRKVRTMPEMNHQMLSFFEPVYQNDIISNDEGEDLLADGIPRPTFGRENNDEQLEMISTSKIVIRIQQIQNSIEQAQTMLESMGTYGNLVPNHTNQREKLRSIIHNLEDQLKGYLDLLTLSAEEPSPPFDHDENDDLSLRRHVRPCIESKIGFSPPPDDEQLLLPLKQQLTMKKTTYLEDDDLLVDIDNLRHRLQFLRNRYEKLRNSSNKPQLFTENRLKNLEHVHERLDELEQFVTYYSPDLNDQRTPEQLDDLSSDLEVKRIELEQAKLALSQLQQMVRPIRSADDRPIFQRETSLLSDMVSPQPLGAITERKTYNEELDGCRPFYREDSLSQSSEDTSLPRLKQSNLCASNNTFESDELNSQMREICRCLSTFIEEQKSFNRHIEQRLTTVTKSSSTHSIDPSQFQQQVQTQGLLVNLNTAYREIAVLQPEINALQSENKRLASSISFDNQYHHQTSQFFSRESSASHPVEDGSKASSDSQSSGQQTAIHVENIHLETTPIRKERKVLPSKEHPGKTFIIRRRPISTNHEYEQPSSYSALKTENLDPSKLDLQVKSIMGQLIPYMRLHIDEIFNQSNLNHIRERIVFLFQQQPESTPSLRHFSELVGKTIQKYCGTTIRDCAMDLLREVSDLAFDEFQTTNPLDSNTQAWIKQKNEYRPLTLISTEEKDKKSRLHRHATELNSNEYEYEYILVNRSLTG